MSGWSARLVDRPYPLKTRGAVTPCGERAQTTPLRVLRLQACRACPQHNAGWAEQTPAGRPCRLVMGMFPCMWKRLLNGGPPPDARCPWHEIGKATE